MTSLIRLAMLLASLVLLGCPTQQDPPNQFGVDALLHPDMSVSCPNIPVPVGACTPGDTRDSYSCGPWKFGCMCSPVTPCACTMPESSWLCCNSPGSFSPCTSRSPVNGTSCCGNGQCVHAASPTAAAVTSCSCAGNFQKWKCTADTAALAIVNNSAVDGVSVLWGSAPDSVWAGRADGNLAHWDGTDWRRVDVGGVLGGSLPHFWGSGPNNIWAASGGGGRPAFLVYDGTLWKPAPVPPPLASSVVAIGGRGPADVWVSSDSGPVPPQVYHWDGTAWTTLSLGFKLDAFWGTATDMWAVGSGFIFRWDGTVWTAVHSTKGQSGYQSMWGSSSNDVWAIPWNNLAPVVHWDGAAWTDMPGAPASLQAVWGLSQNDIWGSATGGLFHYDGVAWKMVAAGDRAASIWGSTGVIWLANPPMMRYLL